MRATTSVYNLSVTVIVGFTAGISVLTAQMFGKDEKEIVNFGSGIATIVAQNIGAGNKKRAKRY